MSQVHVNMTFEEYLELKGHYRNKLNNLRRQAGLKAYNGNFGKPSPMRGKPNSSKGKPRPHMRGYPKPTLRGPKPDRWIVGPDAERHERFQPWHKARAQANYRGEIWDLTFDQWYDIWGDKWDQRGRGADQYCMVLIDPDHGWTVNNVEVITRREHLQRLGFNRKGTLRRAQ